MKKIAITLILLTCIVTGVLHSNFRQHEQIENTFGRAIIYDTSNRYKSAI